MQAGPFVLRVSKLIQRLLCAPGFPGESILSITGVVVASLFVFTQPPQSLGAQPWVVLLTLAWPALRGGTLSTVLGVVFVGLLATWNTARGIGPWAEHTFTSAFISLTVFIAGASLLSLLIALLARLQVGDDRNEELRRLEADLHRAIATVESAARVKNEFLLRTCHELRTPLNAILGFAQLLQLNSPQPEQREHLVYILRAGWHLVGLISDLIDIIRLEQGDTIAETKSVPIASVLREAIAQIESQANERSIGLRIELPRGCNIQMRADARRVRRVLSHLLSNAVKFSPEFGEVVALVKDNGDGTLAVAVRDSGPGIAPERLPTLFEPFSRPATDGSLCDDGVGLGLALSQRLAQSMGGQLLADSAAGRGSTFTLVLPVSATSHKSPATTAMETSCPQVTMRRVLLVEDNVANTELIRAIVNREGRVELLTAALGHIGLELALGSVDVVLLDLHLPDMSGEDFLQQFRQLPGCDKVPVVVLSADTSPSRIERLKRQGVAQYLSKPFDVEKFQEVLTGVLLSLDAVCPSRKLRS